MFLGNVEYIFSLKLHLEFVTSFYEKNVRSVI